MNDRLCVGVITGAHGVDGVVRIKSFVEDPSGLADFGELTDETGQRRFHLEFLRQAKGVALARLEGVRDRDAALSLKGVRLTAPKDALPETEDEDDFYISDLVGLSAESVTGEPLGRVRGVADFGAGDVIEIDGDGGSFMIPFTRKTTPVVDVKAGRIIVDLPVFVEGKGTNNDAG
ncbi:ribosome maturation factor RimM [Alphaproteobacteria bacterium]|nr:ribosome maturation factor RimM [Alphaproteobacteria bacterium]